MTEENVKERKSVRKREREGKMGEGRGRREELDGVRKEGRERREKQDAGEKDEI